MDILLLYQVNYTVAGKYPEEYLSGTKNQDCLSEQSEEIILYEGVRNRWIVGSGPTMTMKRKQLQASLEAVFPGLSFPT